MAKDIPADNNDKFTVDGEIVTAEFTWRFHKRDERKSTIVNFDFSKVSREELLVLALDQCKQRWRNLVRAMADFDGNVDLSTVREIDVKTSLIETSRKAKDTPEAREAKALEALHKAGATPEIIEAYKASMRKNRTT